MSRFLLAVPPMTGHTLPMTAVARALEADGHEVAWVGSDAMVGHLLPDEAVLFDAPPGPDGREPSAEAYRSTRGAGAFQLLVDGLLVPCAHAMVPVIEEAVEAFSPDVLVAEQLAWGGSLAARRLGLPWATVAASFGTRRLALRWLPPVIRWVDERWRALEDAHGLEPEEEPESSPSLNIVLTSRDFVGGDAPWPESFHFVGPVTERPPDDTPFPWEALEPGPAVLVSLGSVESVRGERFYRAAAEGLGDLDARVVVVAPEAFGPFPEPWTVRSWVPQLELLRRIDAVVTHGGMNTVHEALSEGLPLVVAPVVNDQGWIAERVVENGAGVRVSFGRPRPEEIRRAVETVLSDPGLRRGAEALAESFARGGGTERAAALLGKLAGPAS